MIRRVWFPILAVLAVVASAAVASGVAPAGRLPSTTVLERSCLDPDSAELAGPWVAVGPAGTRVELWCGTRLEVTNGRCSVRLGGALTPVPCVGAEPRHP